MKATYLLSFLGGAAVMLGMTGLLGSDAKPSHHVYELRLLKKLGKHAERAGADENDVWN